MADKKFIPDSDSDFALMARNFAKQIANNPVRYLLSVSDAEIITQAVKAFRDALTLAVRVSTRTKITIMAKDDARMKAERIVRKHANQIRVNDRISHVDKMLIEVRERPRRLRRRKCPKQPPYLRYVGSEKDMHILEFREEQFSRSKAKPFGAARLELFVDLVEPGELVPERPDNRTGRPWYLRSFTTNPIRVEFPMPKEPMRVVYWGRWADATGEVGKWSETVQARVEGWPPAPGSCAPGSCAPGNCATGTGSGSASGTELKVAA